MIYGQASATVSASPGQVLDFVADLARYRQADTKIRSVLSTRRDGADIVVRFRSRLRGIPTPAIRQRVTRSGNERLDITSEPSWQTKLASFHGWVTCSPTATGTLVTHHEQLQFHGPGAGLMERYLRAWLAADVAAEVERMATLLNADTAATSTRRSAPLIAGPSGGGGDLLASHDEHFANFAATLSTEQWAAPSLCAGWSNHDVLAHVVSGYNQRPGQLLAALGRYRGSFAAATDQLTRRYARQHQVPALLAQFDQLRRHRRGIGRIVPARVLLADHVVHYLDIALALGLQPRLPAHTVRAVLDLNVANPFVPTFSNRAGLSLHATDIDWHRVRANCPDVYGPSAALISVLTGRSLALDQLHGPGVDILRHRVPSNPTPAPSP